MNPYATIDSDLVRATEKLQRLERERELYPPSSASSTSVLTKEEIDNQRRRSQLTADIIRVNQQIGELRAKKEKSREPSGPIPPAGPIPTENGSPSVEAMRTAYERQLSELTRVREFNEREIVRLRAALEKESQRLNGPQNEKLEEVRARLLSREQEVARAHADISVLNQRLEAATRDLRVERLANETSREALRTAHAERDRLTSESARLQRELSTLANQQSGELERLRGESQERINTYARRIEELARQIGAAEVENQARRTAADRQIVAEHERTAVAARQAQLAVERDAADKERRARELREKTAADDALRQEERERAERAAREAERALLRDQAAGTSATRQELGTAARETRDATRAAVASNERVQRDASELVAAQSAADQARGAAGALAVAATAAAVDARDTTDTIDAPRRRWRIRRVISRRSSRISASVAAVSSCRHHRRRRRCCSEHRQQQRVS